MTFKGIHLRVPRAQLQSFVDLMEMNGFLCKSEEQDGPAHVAVNIPEVDLFDWPGEMCEACGGWDGKHEPDCDGLCPDCTGELSEHEPKDKTKKDN